ncbi:MAG TPA: PIG-L deacetylase family protein [Parafilimonas sp.]|nr:PIG-L deacetylase family protein [Parafilimonas sp.]
MEKKNSTRRNFIKNTLAGTCSLSLLSLAGVLQAQPIKNPADKKKIVVAGGHPDDPESGCGGTIAKLTNLGHEVTLMYFTTGEEGIEGKTWEEAGAIRRKEAIEACKVLNAKPLFVGQIDGESVLGNPQMADFKKLLYAEKPDIVFTHWPVDSHKDHQLASVLTIQSWLEAKEKFALYFYEVCIGEQSFLFHPTDYVDITDTQEQKKKALYCHASQDPPGIYACGHAAMEDFRGRESGVHAAEAFIKMTSRGFGKLNF